MNEVKKTVKVQGSEKVLSKEDLKSKIASVEVNKPTKRVRPVGPFEVLCGPENRLKNKLNELYQEKGDFDVLSCSRSGAQNVVVVKLKTKV